MVSSSTSISKFCCVFHDVSKVYLILFLNAFLSFKRLNNVQSSLTAHTHSQKRKLGNNNNKPLIMGNIILCSLLIYIYLYLHSRTYAIICSTTSHKHRKVEKKTHLQRAPAYAQKPNIINYVLTELNVCII